MLLSRQNSLKSSKNRHPHLFHTLPAHSLDIGLKEPYNTSAYN